MYRPTTGEWLIRSSSAGNAFVQYQWGYAGDVPIAADFDGDGTLDLTVYRPTTGQWFIRYSSTGTPLALFEWGANGDVPIGCRLRWRRQGGSASSIGRPPASGSSATR